MTINLVMLPMIHFFPKKEEEEKRSEKQRKTG